MEYVIIIPAYNEEAYINNILTSIANQTVLPKQVVIVNDCSSDNTADIISNFQQNHSWIKLINITKKEKRSAGAKIIRTFYRGFSALNVSYDYICKLDADIILPENYFEVLKEMFTVNKNLGIAGGTIYHLNKGEWVYENFSDKDHVKGAFKFYKKSCFDKIGGLKHSIGWDSVDELLAMYHGFDVEVNQNLMVKHLRPLGKETGFIKIRYQIGHGLYRMRYGIFISCISALKTAFRDKPYIISGIAVLLGYLASLCKNDAFIVTKEEGKFIRKYRINRMKIKLSNFLK